MGVRRGDTALRDELDDFLVRRRAARSTRSSMRYGVPRVEAHSVLTRSDRQPARRGLPRVRAGCALVLLACVAAAAGCEREARRYQELPAAANRETGCA